MQQLTSYGPLVPNWAHITEATAADLRLLCANFTMATNNHVVYNCYSALPCHDTPVKKGAIDVSLLSF